MRATSACATTRSEHLAVSPSQGMPLGQVPRSPSRAWSNRAGHRRFASSTVECGRRSWRERGGGLPQHRPATAVGDAGKPGKGQEAPRCWSIRKAPWPPAVPPASSTSDPFMALSSSARIAACLARRRSRRSVSPTARAEDCTPTARQISTGRSRKSRALLARHRPSPDPSETGSRPSGRAKIARMNRPINSNFLLKIIGRSGGPWTHRSPILVQPGARPMLETARVGIEPPSIVPQSRCGALFDQARVAVRCYAPSQSADPT